MSVVRLKGVLLPQVTFVGEGAVDSGGPRREFFRLLASEASNTLFIGNVTAKFFVMNAQALQVSTLTCILCNVNTLSLTVTFYATMSNNLSVTCESISSNHNFGYSSSLFSIF